MNVNYVFVEYDPDDYAFLVYWDVAFDGAWMWYEKRTPVNEAIDAGYCGA